MTQQEAQKALKEGLQVVVVRLGKPQSPYVGRISRILGNGHFLFEGKSESENLSGKVTAGQIAFWQD